MRPAAEAKGIRLRDRASIRSPARSPATRAGCSRWCGTCSPTPSSSRRRAARSRSCCSASNSHVEIIVADTGIGIQPEFLPHVFERFRQADASTTRSTAGSGSGLSIVKQLVELHGGTVRAQSAGEGRARPSSSAAAVVVRIGRTARLRRIHPAAPTAAAADSSVADLSGLKVLVVDDEPDARDSRAAAARGCGAEVLTAATGEEALAAGRSATARTCWSATSACPARRLRAARARPRAGDPRAAASLPAIALTAFARSEDRTRALRAGFLVHVSKPVEPAELIATVASAASRTGKRL